MLHWVACLPDMNEVRSWFLFISFNFVTTYLSITPIFGDWRVDLCQRWWRHSTYCHCTAARRVQIGCNSSSLARRTVVHHRQSGNKETKRGMLKINLFLKMSLTQREMRNLQHILRLQIKGRWHCHFTYFYNNIKCIQQVNV